MQPNNPKVPSLSDEILSAFSYHELRNMLRLRLGVELEHVVPIIDSTLTDMVNALVHRYASHKNGLFELVESAHKERPNKKGLGYIFRNFQKISDDGDLGILSRPASNQISGIEKPSTYISIPAMRGHFIGREEDLVNLADALTLGDFPQLALVGMGGIGKTKLMIALARHPRVLESFRDGVLWARVGQDADLHSIQALWAETLGIESRLKHVGHSSRRMEIINNEMRDKQILIMLDDVWNSGQAIALTGSGRYIVTMLTTRLHDVAEDFVAYKRDQIHIVEGLSKGKAHLLLNTLAPKAWKTKSSKMIQLADAVGGVPLGLEVLGGYLGAMKRSAFEIQLNGLIEKLQEPAYRLKLPTWQLGGSDEVKVTLNEVIGLSLDELRTAQPRAVEVLFGLSLFPPKPHKFDLQSAIAVTASNPEMIAELVARNLLELDDDEALSFHPFIRDYVKTQYESDDHQSGLESAKERFCRNLVARVKDSADSWGNVSDYLPQIRNAYQYDPSYIVESLRTIVLDSSKPVDERRHLAYLLVNLDWYGCDESPEKMLEYYELITHFMDLPAHTEGFVNCIRMALEDSGMPPLIAAKLIVHRAVMRGRANDVQRAILDYKKAASLLGNLEGNSSLRILRARINLGLGNANVMLVERKLAERTVLSSAEVYYGKAFDALQDHANNQMAEVDPKLTVTIICEHAVCLLYQEKWSEAIGKVELALGYCKLIDDQYVRTAKLAYILETQSRIYYERGADINDFIRSLDLCKDEINVLRLELPLSSILACAHLNAAESLIEIEKLDSHSTSDHRSEIKSHLLNALSIASELNHQEYVDLASKYLDDLRR